MALCTENISCVKQSSVPISCLHYVQHKTVGLLFKNKGSGRLSDITFLSCTWQRGHSYPGFGVSLFLGWIPCAHPTLCVNTEGNEIWIKNMASSSVFFVEKAAFPLAQSFFRLLIATTCIYYFHSFLQIVCHWWRQNDVKTLEFMIFCNCLSNSQMTIFVAANTAALLEQLHSFFMSFTIL